MPRRIWNLEWLNHNSQRSYPLTEDATKKDITDVFEIPDDFILSIYFPVHAGNDVLPGRFFLSALSIFSTGYNITISYNDGTGSPPIVASAIIAKSAHSEYTSYALPGQGDFDDSVGKIVIGRLVTIDALSPGQYEFDFADGKLETDCIRPMIQYVSSIVLLNGAERSARLQGDIELQAGTNIRLTPIVTSGVTTVRIDAIDGEGLSEVCVCEDDSESPCIRTINGIPPTASGDFTILGSTCMDVEPLPSGIKFVDSCSEPCCGCEELEALTRELELFGTAATTVQGFVNRLQSEVTNMSQVVLGSRLGDEGCAVCEVG